MATVTATNDDILKPQLDTRQYRALTLQNQLRALLIHDPAADKAGASLTVEVGSYQDPPGISGLAHFCEHMLFLGTEKYPDEDSYNTYLSAHGGSSNAYTAGQQTTYFFDVAKEHLEGALDRFSQFFISPLFTASATDRELNAVDSEHRKNVQSDQWRVLQLLRDLGHPRHPCNRFSTGNLETLKTNPTRDGVDVRAALLDFHSRYYSANSMGLCVVGSDSLDQLQQWVVDKFSAVVNKNVTMPRTFDVPAYGPDHMKKAIYVRPVRDVHTLRLIFDVPASVPIYIEKPYRYLFMLLGHEGAGSLLSHLKKLGWADALSVGFCQDSSDFSTAVIEVMLTVGGVDHTQEIVKKIFAYISMLKRNSVDMWRWEEEANLSRTTFRFSENENAITTTSSLSPKMLHYPPRHVVAADSLLFEYNEAGIRAYLDRFNPDNFSFLVQSQLPAIADRCTSTNKWYGTPFHIDQISPEFLEELRAQGPIPELFLPEPNIFIPTDFSVAPPRAEGSSAAVPRLVGSNPRYRLWFKRDDTFFVPKTNVFLKMTVSHAFDTPTGFILKSLFSGLVEDSLNEYSYAATLASLSFNFALGQDGSFSLVFQGYTHKMPELAHTVLGRIGTFTFEDERFHLIKALLQRQLLSHLKNQPYADAMYMGGWILRATARWLIPDLLDAIDGVTPADLRDFIPKFHRVHVEGLVEGSLDEGAAIALLDTAVNTLKTVPLESKFLPERRIVQLPAGTAFEHRFRAFNEEDENSALYSYFQVGFDDQRRRDWLLLQLTMQVLEKRFYHQLRTTEQLGYIIHSGVASDAHVGGASFLLQSGSKEPAYLDERLEVFLQETRKVLADLPNDEFEDNVRALITKKMEKDTTLNQEASRFYNEINNGGYFFDREAAECARLRDLTKSDLVEFFESRFMGDQRRKLSVLVHGASHPVDPNATPVAGATALKDLYRFKRSLPTFQCPTFA